MTYHGVHINQANQGALATLYRARPALVKTLDHGPDWATIKVACDIKFLLGRLWLDDQANFEPTPEAAAERLFEMMRLLMLKWRGVYDAWETPWNEYAQRGPDLALHARACRRFCELAHNIGVKVAVGNFSVGNPEPPELASLFAPGLEKADYLSLHEYWLPGAFNAPWWVGRWQRLVEALPLHLRRPVIITECGIDGGLESRPHNTAGWRAYNIGAEEYAAELQAYVDNLDERVLGVAVFNLGDYDGGRWQSFEIAATPPIELWLGTGPRDPLPTPTEPPMSFPATDRLSALLAAEFGDRFEDVRTRLPDGDYGLGNYPARPVEAVTDIAIHHTATVSTATVETVHRQHTTNNRWGGTGYTMFVDGAARVYLTGTLETVRAHVGGTDPTTGQGWNYKTVGVCLAGSFMEYQPTLEQRDAARRVLGCLYQIIGEKPYRGHKEFNGAPATACPGSTWDQWRTDLAPRPVVPPVRFDKVVWALEEATRVLEREGLINESRFIADSYTMDAIIRRDGQ